MFLVLTGNMISTVKELTVWGRNLWVNQKAGATQHLTRTLWDTEVGRYVREGALIVIRWPLQSVLPSGSLTNTDPTFELSLELSASLHAQMLVGSLPTQGTALASGDTVLSQTKLIPTLRLGRWVIHSHRRYGHHYIITNC